MDPTSRPTAESASKNAGGMNRTDPNSLDKTQITSDPGQDVTSTETFAETPARTAATPKPDAKATPVKQGTGAVAGAAPAPAEKPARINQLGDFKLIRKLGQGGMGEVYLAHQISLDRDVALKILSKKIASNPNFVERFYREARTMAKLDHPHIVRGFAVGEAQGFHYVAMELIDGKSMQDWLEKLGKLEVGDALHIAMRATDALLHAHQLNLVHRDIKPDNMLVTSKGVLKVSDLGLAKNLDEDNSMTQSGTGLGTPYYMPPEQARNAKHVDQRSDIYALGSTLYHFLAGDYPFRAESTLELILTKEKGTFAPLRKLNTAVPERLDLIIGKMMAKDPQHRYQNCAELLHDLESLGLANETLSFVEGAVPSSATPRGRSSVTKPSAGATAAGAGGTMPKLPPSTNDVAAPQVWFLKYNDKGRIKSGRFTTAQLLTLIKSEQIDLSAKASKTEEGDYRPMAQFTELSHAVNHRLIKQKADKKATVTKDIYDEIDRADRRRKKWKWFWRLTESTGGLIGLVVYLTLVAVVLYGAYFGVVNYVMPKIGEYKPIQEINSGLEAVPKK